MKTLFWSVCSLPGFEPVSILLLVKRVIIELAYVNQDAHVGKNTVFKKLISLICHN
jgi:hypothetical protein